MKEVGGRAIGRHGRSGQSVELYKTRDLVEPGGKTEERTKQRRSILRSLEQQEEHGDCLIHETWNRRVCVCVSALNEEEMFEEVRKRGGGPKAVWTFGRPFGCDPFAMGDSLFRPGPTASEPWHSPS